MSISLQNVATSRLPQRREKISTGRVGVLMILLMVGFCLLVGSMILTMRQQIWVDTARTSQNLLEAEVAGIDRILTIYDASLRWAVHSASSPLLRNASPAVRRLAMFDDVQDTPELGPVRILDGDGTVTYDADRETPAPATDAELRALALHGGVPGGAVQMSGPFPVGGGRFALTLSHRISARNGDFAGIVVGTIDLGLFQKEFARLSVGPHDSVSLFSNSGVMLAHIPGDPWVGRSIAGSNLLQRFREQSAGTFVAPAALDGVRRVFSFRHVAPWPVFLDVGLSTQDLYRPWYMRTIVIGVLMATLLVSAVVLRHLFRRDLQARRLTEKDLVDSEHRYRLLAASASDVIVRADRQTIRTYVSPSCRQYGYAPEDLVGLVSSEWVHPDDLAYVRDTFLRTIDEQMDADVTFRLRTASGEYTWVRSHLSPIQQGGYLAVIRNIDRDKEADRRDVSVGAVV